MVRLRASVPEPTLELVLELVLVLVLVLDFPAASNALRGGSIELEQRCG